MNATDAIRAGLAALAAEEEASPSRVWEPVLPDRGIPHTEGSEEDGGRVLTLTVDGPLYEALAYLAQGTDGSLEEIARKVILDAALYTRIDDTAFAHTVAAHTA
jgi:fermentation-respiration switch protein FrsA (DUF1100 family)